MPVQGGRRGALVHGGRGHRRVLLRLDQLTGVTHVDHATGRVRVLAGTALHELNPALQAVGLALPNLGDIDRQTHLGRDLHRHPRHRAPAAGHRLRGRRG